MRQKPKPIKPLKRETHFADETWTWSPGVTGVRIRSPEGKTTFVNRDQFMYKMKYNYGMPGEADYPFYCCEECCPAWGGPGFTPGLIKTYIRVVLKNGGTWIKPWLYDEGVRNSA